MTWNSDLRQDPRAIPVRRRSLVHVVTIAEQAGICKTLEGPVSYCAGDAIVTGVQGEQWPVSSGTFSELYEPEDGTLTGGSGHYRRRPLAALALQLDQDASVPVGTANGSLKGEPGDWLIQHAPGVWGVVQENLFSQSYILIPPNSNARNPLRSE